MACEKWWFSCCYVNLFIVAIGFSNVVAERGDSFYRYDVSPLTSSSSAAIEWTKFYPHDKLLVRNARNPIELPNTENANSTAANSTAANSTAANMTMLTNKTNGSLDNVAYSTENSTKNSTASSMAPTNPQTKPEVIVSQPLNPATGKTDLIKPSVWANATMRPPTTVIQNSLNDTKNETKLIGDVESAGNDMSINKFGDVTNTTLSENNITKTVNDTHQYYNSSFFVDEAEGKKFWVDMINHPNASVNDVLSHSHRRAATVKLSFDFPFYGHIVRNVTIATGGFLYTGEYVHSWLAATQYIAPLMANFDTTMSNNSWVKYADNGTAFTVEWEKVVLQEKPNVGEFTFQVTLHKNGDIVFVYKAVPLVVEKIQDNLHPVKVGLSDAYIIDRTVFFVRRKTIYEYHRVNFMSQDIKNWTVIYLRALPTCLRMNNCNDCVNKTTGFDCKWCPNLNRCSTGTDRYRQDWLVHRCELKNIKEGESCPAPPSSTPDASNTTTYDEHQEDNENVHKHKGSVHSDDVLSANVQPSQHQAKALGPIAHTPDKMRMGVSGIIGILVVVSLIAGFVGWAVYAYRNPHSASGQVLIRYRPSQWSWRRGEARYTAATIHM